MRRVLNIFSSKTKTIHTYRKSHLNGYAVTRWVANGSSGDVPVPDGANLISLLRSVMVMRLTGQYVIMTWRNGIAMLKDLLVCAAVKRELPQCPTGNSYQHMS